MGNAEFLGEGKVGTIRSGVVPASASLLADISTSCISYIVADNVLNGRSD